MRNIIFPILTLCLSFSCIAQSQEEVAVRDVIVRLFKGMEKGDSAMVHAAFAKDITMATIFRNKNNEPVIHHESSLNDFLKAVGTPHEEVWYEEFWNLKIQIDGDLAQVWCDYAFYIDDTFSHCGVDAIHLHKQKDGWKIFHLADTRRKQNCNIPQEIQDKHR
ncbi:MAG TPA: nuclear transport factor 2 family protein [Ohtaekwangia sp.]|nr:nuclear transport factor 2 family protein [Ohtaekwangia sp.]